MNTLNSLNRILASFPFTLNGSAAQSDTVTTVDLTIAGAARRAVIEETDDACTLRDEDGTLGVINAAGEWVNALHPAFAPLLPCALTPARYEGGRLHLPDGRALHTQPALQCHHRVAVYVAAPEHADPDVWEGYAGLWVDPSDLPAGSALTLLQALADQAGNVTPDPHSAYL